VTFQKEKNMNKRLEESQNVNKTKNNETVEQNNFEQRYLIETKNGQEKILNMKMEELNKKFEETEKKSKLKIEELNRRINMKDMEINKLKLIKDAENEIELKRELKNYKDQLDLKSNTIKELEENR
jgi:hypothetical protein